MVMKLLWMIARIRTLSAGENRPSRRAKMRKTARKPAKPIPSSAIKESCSFASTRFLAAQRIGAQLGAPLTKQGSPRDAAARRLSQPATESSSLAACAKTPRIPLVNRIALLRGMRLLDGDDHWLTPLDDSEDDRPSTARARVDDVPLIWGLVEAVAGLERFD